MAVTIYDLAREAHVSIATVSKALNNSYTISDKTRERIQTLARQMNYQPNARARSFARQRNGTVLFAANLARGVAFEDPHLFEIINGVERRLDEKGYSLLIKHVPPEDAPESLRRCLTRDGDGNGRFHLTPEVYLTAADVRNLQLAKAAVAAGIRVLLQQRGITPEQVDGVYLAGGFGSYLDPESAMAIGMLPRACAGRLHTLGNTALAGAAALALAPAQWQRIGDISRACSYLELSGRADFAAAFTGNLSFPQP